MTKTICDKCGAECTSIVGHIALHVSHNTNQDEIVASDNYIGIDLCGECVEILKKEYGFRSHPKHSMGEDVMVATFAP